MKRFSPYVRYKIKGEISCSSVGPDGKREDSADLIGERIKKIRSMFPPRFRLRARQEEIMRLILSGKDTFAVLPTGGGKSLCFQAPSVFFPGITVVITPLVALIENQVHNFNCGHYPRYHSASKDARQVNYYENLWFKAIYPGMDGLSMDAMFSEIQNPKKKGEEKREVQYKLLYVSPERLCDQKFLRALWEAEKNGLQIPHVVIDEVHCMSQWGFDFRESYLQIAGFIRQRPMRPIISAFTATATPKDRAEIKNLLGFPVNEEEYAKKKYGERFDVEKRNNLLLRVERCSDYERKNITDDRNRGSTALKTRKERLLEILEKNRTKVCIIYRTTVAGVDELYDSLRDEEGLRNRLVKYHARMPEKEKREHKNGFLRSYDEEQSREGQVRAGSEPCKNILIATKAFGMGIDKDDISLVIHYDMPRSLEDYYQEVGRAGRNGKKVPMARCYLLYAGGPQNEKGTLQYTIQWVLSEKESKGARCHPISSQFSQTMWEHIYFWSYYRICYMRTYCEYALQYPNAAQNFIIRYLNHAFTMEQVSRELDSFYKYIFQYYQIPEAQREAFLETHLFDHASACPFLASGLGQRQQPDVYHKELHRLVNQVNELHINNTYTANLLRDHPEKYQLNQPCFPERDPDCGLNKNELVFVVYGEEKLSYFDMCVLDAIYSIEISQEKIIFVQTIWEILTGRNPRYSSQEKRTFRREIQNSIDKMRSMFLSVSDHSCGFAIERQVFLPLKNRPKGQKGYSYSAVPPLFQYAEEKNGQIIKVPVSLFNAEKMERDTLWRNDFRAACKGGKETLDGEGCHSFDCCVKYLPLDSIYELKLREHLDERDARKWEEIQKRTCRFRPSMNHVLLCHYLIRRIAISKRKKRGNFILFSTIKAVTGIREDTCLFHKKAAAIMDHYRRMGYVYDYQLYITNYAYERTDGGTRKEAAYFQIQAKEAVKYWKLHGRNYLLLSDFLISWCKKPRKEVPEEKESGNCENAREEDGSLCAKVKKEEWNLCADTKRKLALASLEQMEGMVLLHEV